MDLKARLALRKKRELLGNNNKRKMSLRRRMDRPKQSECRLDITQVTKCVFLGSLCLKPVPQLFDSPLLLEELDMKAGHGVNDENLRSCDKKSPPIRRKSCTSKRLKSPKIRKKSLREKNTANDEKVDFVATDAPPKNSVAAAETIESEPEQASDRPSDIDYDELLKREGTPELVLLDADDDTIDQLMFNIMDIKMTQNVFARSLFEVSASDMEVYEDFSPQGKVDVGDEFAEYSPVDKMNEEENDEYERKSEPDDDKKCMKRKPHCKICSQIFPSYVHLNKHKATHDGDRPYLCLKCDENHTTLDELLAHLRTHEGKRPYVCKKCNKGFKTTRALQNHQPVHVLRKVVAPKKTFPCETCGKEFRKLCDLERHTRVHTGEKPSVCNICNRRFQQAHNLNKHLLIHTQEKPFKCDICDKKFGRSDVLNRHLLTHSVKKPNHCGTCMKSFIRVSQLLVHKEKYHSGKNT